MKSNDARGNSRDRTGLIVIGVFGALLALEGAVRVVDDSRHFISKKFLWHAPYLGHCYATDPFHSFPLDVRRPEDALFFHRRFPDTPVEPLLQTPFCISYDTSETSQRVWTGPEQARERIALIGDSFAFGEGVRDDQTLGYYLAQARRARVRSYAVPGADLPEVRKEFDRVLQDHRRAPFTSVCYIFVLNDPLLAPALRTQRYRLNDLMNVRFEWLDPPRDLHGMTGLLWKAGRYSELARAIARRRVLKEVTRDTVAWYQAVFDERQNPELVSTLAAIRAMQESAKTRGIRFHLVIYPILFDMIHDPLGNIHKTLRRLTAERGIQTLDLRPAFEPHVAERLIVHPLDAHPNGEAHRIAAEALAHELD